MEKYNIEKSINYNRKLKNYLSGGVHYNFRTLGSEEIIHFKYGKGSKVIDLDDNEYIDFYAKFGAMILGHNNSYYNNSLKNQIDKCLAINHSDIDLDVCKLIKKNVNGIDLLRFGLSGSEMIQNSLRLARAYTKKNKFIRFEGHYHGNMDNVLGGKKSSDHQFSFPIDFYGDPRGTAGRAENIMKNQSYLISWNNYDQLEKLIKAKKQEIGAIILEPICYNGGGIRADKEYLVYLRKVCDENNIILIFDEVITGFRVSLGGTQDIYGIEPDLIIFGKAISNGIPVSVLGGKKNIMRLYETREVIHAGTFNGYPLGLASVKSTINELSKNKSFYDIDKNFVKKIAKIFKESAKNNNIEFSYQCDGGVFIFNCIDKKVKNITDLSMEVMLKNAIVNQKMKEFGILISPVSRVFLNTMFNNSDFNFVQNRIDQIFYESKKVMKEIF